MRRCSGVWPPSNPWMGAPARAFWPFTPRPDVLPRPELEPRPSFVLRLRAPGLSQIWLSFMDLTFQLFLFDDFNQTADFADHAAHGGRVFQRAFAADFAKAK